ncbi:hypothetical protein [Blastococcus sp. SYSU D00695]
MHVDWGTLAEIVVVAAAAALTVVLLVALALVGWSGRPARRAPGAVGADGGHTAVGTAVAALCLLAAGLVVGYGLYLIVS